MPGASLRSENTPVIVPSTPPVPGLHECVAGDVGFALRQLLSKDLELEAKAGKVRFTLIRFSELHVT